MFSVQRRVSVGLCSAIAALLFLTAPVLGMDSDSVQPPPEEAAPVQPEGDVSQPDETGSETTSDTAAGAETASASAVSADAGGDGAEQPAGIGIPLTVPDSSGNSGAASYSIPIVVPPGRAGISPNLSLTYSSNRRNGWIGVGWGLDLGSIQRQTRFGLDYSANSFAASMNGSLVDLVRREDWDIAGHECYEARIEGSFSRFCMDMADPQNNPRWVVTSREGTKYFYGSSAASRQQFSADGQLKVFSWRLDRVEDINGNYMAISYRKDTGEIYPLRIDYTGNSKGSPATPTTNYVEFSLEQTARTDPVLSYASQAQAKTLYRLKTISVYAYSETGPQFVRKYELGYTLSPSTKRSLLSSVTRYGWSGASQQYVSLPPLTFTYQQGGMFEADEVEWEKINREVDPGQPQVFADVNGDGYQDAIYDGTDGDSCGRCLFVILSGRSKGVNTDMTAWGRRDESFHEDNPYYQVADVNGDGKADIVYEDTAQRIRVLLSNGARFLTDAVWTTRSASYDSEHKGFVLADANGDGKADVVYTGSAKGIRVLLSSGSRFSADDHTWGARNFDINHDSSGFRMADVNGDGKADFIYESRADLLNPASFRVLLSRGTNFSPEQNWGAKNQGGYYEGTGGFRMADLNGDGLSDVVYLNSAKSYRVLLATGLKFLNAPEWARAIVDTEVFTTYPIADLNADGLPDILFYINWCCFYALINNGTGFSQPIAWGAVASDPLGFFPKVKRVSDLNGDGLPDLAYHVRSDISPTILHMKKCTPPAPDLLCTVRNEIGGSFTITYEPSSSYANAYLPYIVQAVSSVTADDGLGNTSTTNYSYSGGYHDIVEREFRGFRHVKKTLPDGAYQESWFHQDSDKKGILEASEVRGPDGRRYTRAQLTYTVSAPYTGVVHPALTQRDDFLYDGSETACKLSRAGFEYDSYGNLKRKYLYGDVSVAGDERIEDTLFHSPDEANWIVSLPAEVSIKAVSAGVETVKSKTLFRYYPGSNLLKEKEEVLFDSVSNLAGNCTMANQDNLNPITTYSYDAYGNLTSVVDPEGNITTTSYDTTQTFPEVVAFPPKAPGALPFTTTTTYDYRFGKVKNRTDANGRATAYGYDPFGRLLMARGPNDATSYYGSVSYKYENFGVLGQGTGSQRITTYTTKESGTSEAIWSSSYFDGLGREVMKRSLGPDVSAAEDVVVVETRYDSRGEVLKKSLPYFEGGPALYWSEFHYDPAGRLVESVNPDKTKRSLAYEREKTTIYDPLNHKKEEIRDAFGRLTKVVEYTGSSDSDYALYAQTSYKYDVLGNLTMVVSAAPAGKNVTTLTYDSLSRKTGMRDPDMGIWKYQYDRKGNLTSQCDAKGVKVIFGYDPLGRISSKTYPDGTSITYTYDGSGVPNSKGRLTKVVDPSSTTSILSYDKVGRVLSEKKTIDTLSYTTSRTYNALGQVKTITYPEDAEVVSYTYDSGGFLRDIPGVVSYTNYNAMGQVLGVSFHGTNPVTTTYSYLPDSGRLSSIKTYSSLTGTNLQSITYSYDLLGNVEDVMHWGASEWSQHLSYDDLGRLTSSSSTRYGAISYQYDTVGNITYNSQVGDYLYSTSKPHAVTSAGAVSYQYDVNGNMTVRGSDTLTYDYDNRLRTITTPSGATTLSYDYKGERIRKAAPSSTTIYIGDLFECEAGECIKHIFSGGKRIASRKGTETYFYHTDHLGSLHRLTDSSGAAVQNCYFYPFGKTWSESGSVRMDHKFTGEEEDRETGLYFYGARYFDPLLGRFISADSIVPRPGDPQSLNRYSYARNNPLNRIDPTGNFDIGDFFESFISGFVGGVVTALTGNPMLGGMAAGVVSGAFTGKMENVVIGAGFGGLTGGAAGIGAQVPGGSEVMLAAGIGYSAYEGGLDGFAYFSAGVMGGIAGNYAGGQAHNLYNSGSIQAGQGTDTSMMVNGSADPLSDSNVLSEIERAWTESNPGSSKAHEQAAWVIDNPEQPLGENPVPQHFSVQRFGVATPTGGPLPPKPPNAVLVFHTHPHIGPVPGKPGFFYEPFHPSVGDLNASQSLRIPGAIRTFNGIIRFEPNRSWNYVQYWNQ